MILWYGWFKNSSDDNAGIDYWFVCNGDINQHQTSLINFGYHHHHHHHQIPWRKMTRLKTASPDEKLMHENKQNNSIELNANRYQSFSCFYYTYIAYRSYFYSTYSLQVFKSSRMVDFSMSFRFSDVSIVAMAALVNISCISSPEVNVTHDRTYKPAEHTDDCLSVASILVMGPRCRIGYSVDGWKQQKILLIVQKSG